MTARRRGPRRRASTQGVALLGFFQVNQKVHRGTMAAEEALEVLEASLPRWEAAHRADPRRFRGAAPAIRRWCERYGAEVPAWVVDLEGGAHAGEAPSAQLSDGEHGQRAN